MDMTSNATFIANQLGAMAMLEEEQARKAEIRKAKEARARRRRERQLIPPNSDSNTGQFMVSHLSDSPQPSQSTRLEHNDRYVYNTLSIPCTPRIRARDRMRNLFSNLRHRTPSYSRKDSVMTDDVPIITVSQDGNVLATCATCAAAQGERCIVCDLERQIKQQEALKDKGKQKEAAHRVHRARRGGSSWGFDPTAGSRSSEIWGLPEEFLAVSFSRSRSCEELGRSERSDVSLGAHHHKRRGSFWGIQRGGPGKFS